MKTVRLVTFLIVAILVFSAWTPSPVLARADATTVTIGADSGNTSVDFAAAKLVKLTVINKTGGTLYVRLVGPKNYFFSAPNQGKTSFQIEAGRYTFTVRSSACSGSISKSKNFKGGGSLGPYVCNR
jgi:hypothetical protein